MPRDAMVVWIRGDTLFARAIGDKKHVVRLAAGKPEVLVRALRQRANMAARSAGAKPETIWQATADKWTGEVKRGPKANGITGRLMEQTKQDKLDEARDVIMKLMEEY